MCVSLSEGCEGGVIGVIGVVNSFSLPLQVYERGQDFDGCQLQKMDL